MILRLIVAMVVGLPVGGVVAELCIRTIKDEVREGDMFNFVIMAMVSGGVAGIIFDVSAVTSNIFVSALRGLGGGLLSGLVTTMIGLFLL